jgi:hypothetical protein
MGGFQVVVAVFTTCMLGAVFFALYLLNKSVSQSGR